MNLRFDTRGNDKQKEAAKAWIDPNIEEIVFGGAKSGGKSYLGAALIFGQALMYPDTQWFIARKSLNDLRKHTRPTIETCIKDMGLDVDKYMKYNGQDNYYQLYNNSKVYFLECSYLPSDPLFMRFGSMNMTGGWIEEAGEITESAKNNLKVSIGRWKNKEYGIPIKLLMTCNPSKNFLYKRYYKPYRNDTLLDNVRFIQSLPTDNKMNTPSYIENLRKSLSKNELERLFYGNWEYDSDPAALFDYEAIINLFTNEFVSKEKGKRYITADIARKGRDSTVIGVWDGMTCFRIISIEKNKVTEAAEKIKALANRYSIPMQNVIVDEDGVGGGVKDILNCKGFVNNSRAENGENFGNLKSQCYWKLAEIVNNNKMFVDCLEPSIQEMITEELEQVKAKEILTDNKQKVISKDKVKELIGRSPDYSDMLMMRMYFELKPQWTQFVF